MTGLTVDTVEGAAHASASSHGQRPPDRQRTPRGRARVKEFAGEIAFLTGFQVLLVLLVQETHFRTFGLG